MSPNLKSKSVFKTLNVGRSYMILPKASWRLIEWVSQRSALKGTSKLTAITIASFYNTKKLHSRISYDKISVITGLSESTIIENIKDMKLSGEWLIVSVERSHDSGDYVKYQRYIPLPPDALRNVKGEWLDLHNFIDSKNARNLAKRNTSRYTTDFYDIYRSHWPIKFVEQIIVRPNDSSSNYYLVSDFAKTLKTDEIELIQNRLLARLNNIVIPHDRPFGGLSEEEHIMLTFFEEFRGESLTYRGIKSQTPDKSLVLNKKDLEMRRKIALKIYRNWVQSLRMNSAYGIFFKVEVAPDVY